MLKTCHASTHKKNRSKWPCEMVKFNSLKLPRLKIQNCLLFKKKERNFYRRTFPQSFMMKVEGQSLDICELWLRKHSLSASKCSDPFKCSNAQWLHKPVWLCLSQNNCRCWYSAGFHEADHHVIYNERHKFSSLRLTSAWQWYRWFCWWLARVGSHWQGFSIHVWRCGRCAVWRYHNN